MRTTTTLSIGLTTAVCLGLLLWQRSSIGALKKEAETLTSSLAGEAVTIPSSPSGLVANRPRSKAGGVPTAVRLLSLLNSDEQRPGRMDFFDRLPAVLKEVENCNIAQLLDLVSKLEGDSAAPGSAATEVPFLQMVLLIVIAEEDPGAVLAFIDEGEVVPTSVTMDMRPSVLALLAKTDPDLALSKIEREGITDRERDVARLAIARTLLATDVKAGLKLMEGIKVNSGMPGMAGIVAAARDPQVADNLWREANQMAPGKLRSDIFEGLLGAAMLQGGGTSVEEEFGRIENLEDGERNALVNKLSNDFMMMDPAWTLEFVSNHAHGDHRNEVLKRAIAEWAQSDYNAAGTWLGEQAPSPQRDRMIGSFVRAIGSIDQAAANAWAGEISDPAQREAVLEGIGKNGGSFREEPQAID